MPATKKNKETKALSPDGQFVRDFNVKNDVIFGKIIKRAWKFVPIGSTHKGNVKFRLVGGGFIPSSFGVTTNEHRTMVSAILANADEADHVRRIQDEFIQIGIEHKQDWFGPAKTDADIKEEFVRSRFISAPKLRSETMPSLGYYDPIIRMHCPADATIVDDQDRPIPIQEVAGKEWVEIRFQLGDDNKKKHGGVYFRERHDALPEWGVGAKTICYLKLAKDKGFIPVSHAI